MGRTDNVAEDEVPPPGPGFTTVNAKSLSLAKSAAVISASKLVALINFVVLSFPLTCTTDVLIKLVPVTVRVKAASPSVLQFVERLEIVGLGFETVKAVLVAEVNVPLVASRV
ncbi:hypothetical protein [Pontibacter brevis]